MSVVIVVDVVLCIIVVIVVVVIVVSGGVAGFVLSPPCSESPYSFIVVDFFVGINNVNDGVGQNLSNITFNQV